MQNVKNVLQQKFIFRVISNFLSLRSAVGLLY